jgi:hypothetical protein
VNDEGRHHSAPATNTITGRKPNGWARCRDCGGRAPTAEQIATHRVRSCCGPIAPWRAWDEPRVRLDDFNSIPTYGPADPRIEAWCRAYLDAGA